MKNSAPDTPNVDTAEVERLIKKGAKNPNMHWCSALQLVLWAYENSDQQVPASIDTPEWDSYEDMIELSVQSLFQATEAGIRDSSWRTVLNTAT